MPLLLSPVFCRAQPAPEILARLRGDRRVRLGAKDVERVAVGPLPAGQRNAAYLFLSAMEAGAVPDGVCSTQVGRNVREILEAGLIAVRTGTAVPLPVLIY